jgi:hypothetical protein
VSHLLFSLPKLNRRATVGGRESEIFEVNVIDRPIQILKQGFVFEPEMERLLQ